MIVVNQRQYAEILYKCLSGLGITGLSADARNGVVREAVLRAMNELVTPVYVSKYADENEIVVAGSRFPDALFAIKQSHASLDDGSISISFVGENHNLISDKDRAQKLISQIFEEIGKPYLVVFERGLTYSVADSPVEVAREENLTTVTNVDFGMALTCEQRSMVIAGYIVACLASGSQDTKDKVVIFYGENHCDILKNIKYFSKNLMGQVLLGRSIEYVFVASQEEVEVFSKGFGK